jgi:hypothetical protein
VVGFHWLAGIHRIRVDVPADDRLRWDLLWLALFAVPPLLLAWFVSRRGGGGPTRHAGAIAAALVVTAGLLSLRPPEDASARLVLFRPGADVWNAVSAAEGSRAVGRGRGTAARGGPAPGDAGWRLYRHGALVVGGPGSPAACLNWSKL